MCFSFYSQLLLPSGLIGLLLAVIMSAAMSSTASGLNALASTCSIYKRNLKPKKSDKHYLNATTFHAVLGNNCYSICLCRNIVENPNQLVNIIGSIFYYGTVLGIFLVGFYIKFVKAKLFFFIVP
jgi:Na+/proline symporter